MISSELLKNLLLYVPLSLIGVWRWTYWIVRRVMAATYRPKFDKWPDDQPRPTVSVVTPVYNEDPATFEEAMQLTRTISSSTAFEDSECEAYFDILMSLPEDALIVEIGLEYGRSSSIALQVTQEHGLRYYGIDPFTDIEDAYPRWFDMAKQTGAMYRLAVMHSHEAVIGEPVHCILIDGDHSYDAVVDDCLHFLDIHQPPCFVDALLWGGAVICTH